MANTNYITSIVKVLETPKQRFINNKTLITEFRIAFPQVKKSTIINAIILGDTSNSIASYIRPDDYILIEGFLAVLTRNDSKIKKLKITILKTYPIFLNSNRFNDKL